MPFHAKGRGLLRKMDTTSKAAPGVALGCPCSGPRARCQLPRDGTGPVQRELSLVCPLMTL